jgi:hypothetical protein
MFQETDEMRNTIAVSSIALLLIFGSVMTDVQASMVSYSLGSTFNGTAPTSSSPWLTVAFEDVAGGVQVTIASSLEVSSEFFGQVGINVMGGGIASLSPGSMEVLSGAFALPTFGSGKMQGTGNESYDILLSFENPPAVRFNGTIDAVRFLLTGVNVTDNFTGITPEGIAAHVQGIPASGGGTTSGAVTTPIPAAIYLLGSGLMGLVVLRRKMKR